MSLEKHTYRLANGTLKESKSWYFRFTLNNKIHYGSTKTSNKKMAEAIERKKYDDAVKRSQLGEKKTITTKDALEKFLKTQERNGEYRNIKTYVKKMLGTKDSSKHDDVVIDIYGFNHDNEFHELADSDVQELILTRRTERNADATIILEMVQLGKAIKIIGKLGFAVPTINFRELKKDNQLKPAKPKLRYLTPEEETRLMSELDPAKGKNWQIQEERAEMRDFVIVLLDTGARYSEIATLEWTQVDLENRTINLFRSKVDNESILQMTDRMYEVLKRRHEEKRADQVYVFEDSEHETHRKYAPKAFNNACKRAGIKNCTLKTCRKTFASRYVQVEGDLLGASKLLGHASPQTTAKYYAHLAPNQASVKAVAVMNKINASRTQAATPAIAHRASESLVEREEEIDTV